MPPTSDQTNRHLQRLAALVAQRRAQMNLTMEDAAKACGIAYATYWKIENAQDVRRSTYAKVEVAYGMHAGSCRAILDGAESIVLADGSELIEHGQIRDFKSRQLEEEVDRAFDKSAQLTAPHLTLSEAKAMKDEMLRELRERGVLKPE
jgi:transcriptional regulator with XRE-family HTH domain